MDSILTTLIIQYVIHQMKNLSLPKSLPRNTQCNALQALHFLQRSWEFDCVVALCCIASCFPSERNLQHPQGWSIVSQLILSTYTSPVPSKHIVLRGSQDSSVVRTRKLTKMARALSMFLSWPHGKHMGLDQPGVWIRKGRWPLPVYTLLLSSCFSMTKQIRTGLPVNIR